MVLFNFYLLILFEKYTFITEIIILQMYNYEYIYIYIYILLPFTLSDARKKKLSFPKKKTKITIF